MIRGSGCSKSRLAKAAGAEVAVQQRNEKWHAAVARSAFSSQNAQKATCSEPFSIWKNGTPLWREAHFQVKMHKRPHARSHFRSGNMARRCGVKHICTSKCTKHSGSDQFLKV